MDQDGKLTPCPPNIPDNPTIHYFKVEAIVQMQRWDLFHEKSDPDKPDRDLTETNWNKLSINKGSMEFICPK